MVVDLEHRLAGTFSLGRLLVVDVVAVRDDRVQSVVAAVQLDDHEDATRGRRLSPARRRPRNGPGRRDGVATGQDALETRGPGGANRDG